MAITKTKGTPVPGKGAWSSSISTKNPSKKSNPKLGSTSKKDQSSLLEELLVGELKDIYWAEKKLVKTLPKMAKAATSAELKNTFSDHLEITKGHVTRLEKAFGLLNEKIQAKKCEAMEGLTKEGEEIIEDTKQGTLTRDVGLIMAAQKVEHYEIATYGSLAQLAKTLGKNELADLMLKTLGEEKQADVLLTSIAENQINIDAKGE